MHRTTQADEHTAGRARPGRGGAGRPVPAGPAGAHGAGPGRSQWAAWAFLAPVVVYLVVFYAYPLYRNLDLSLRDYTVRSFVQGDAPFTGLDNYRTVFADPTFAPALRTPWCSPSCRWSSSSPSGWPWRCSSTSTSGCRPPCARCSSCRGCCR